MNVEVIDRLPSILPVIDHQTKSCSQHPFPLGNASSYREEVPHKPHVFTRDRSNTSDRLLRNHQHMHGRLRMNVAKCQRTIVLEDDVCGNLARDDAFEEGQVGL
jgi:hypothetical protein